MTDFWNGFFRHSLNLIDEKRVEVIVTKPMCGRTLATINFTSYYCIISISVTFSLVMTLSSSKYCA